MYVPDENDDGPIRDSPIITAAMVLYLSLVLAGVFVVVLVKVFGFSIGE